MRRAQIRYGRKNQKYWYICFLHGTLHMVPWVHVSLHSNCFSIGSTVSAQLIPLSNTHKPKHTDHATCDICSNRQHLCTTCRQCCLIRSPRSLASESQSPWATARRCFRDPMSNRFGTIPACDKQTEGEIHWQTYDNSMYHASIALRGKNRCSYDHQTWHKCF